MASLMGRRNSLATLRSAKMQNAAFVAPYQEANFCNSAVSEFPFALAEEEGVKDEEWDECDGRCLSSRHHGVRLI